MYLALLNSGDQGRALAGAKGFDTEGADGVIGKKTESAISAYQQSIGVQTTGKPSLSLLQSLRGTRGA